MSIKNRKAKFFTMTAMVLSLILSFSINAFALNWHNVGPWGGNGGNSFSKEIAGYYGRVVGIFGRAGRLIDQLGFVTASQ